MRTNSIAFGSATALALFAGGFAALQSGFTAAQSGNAAVGEGAGPGIAVAVAEDEKVLPAPKLPDPVGAKKLPKPDEVWVDAKKRQVLVDGYVTLREGYLEMFACLVGTKEHESIVAV